MRLHRVEHMKFGNVWMYFRVSPLFLTVRKHGPEVLAAQLLLPSGGGGAGRSHGVPLPAGVDWSRRLGGVGHQQVHILLLPHWRFFHWVWEGEVKGERERGRDTLHV